jgi:hypothetical protein
MGGGAATGGGSGATCTVTCTVDPPQECQPTMSGGVCVDAYRVTLRSPTSGQVFNLMNTTAPIIATVVRTDGGSPPASLTSVPLAIPGWPAAVPALLRDGGTEYDATLNLPALEGNFVARAGWAPSPQDQVAFRVDRIAPTLSISLPALAPDAGGFLRDAIVPAALRSNEPLDVNGISVTMSGATGPAVAQGVDSAGTLCASRGLALGMNDVCLRLDFAGPTLNALNGSFTVAVTARDLAGNPSTVSTPAPATRQRWVQRIASTFRFSASPALDSQGNVYIGAENQLNLGAIYSYTPDGLLRTNFPLTGIGAVQSLAITQSSFGSNNSGEVVMVAVNTGLAASPSAAMKHFNTNGTAFSSSGGPSCTSDRYTYSAIALYDGGVTGNGMVAHGTIVFSQGNGDTSGVFCDFSMSSGGATASAAGWAQPTPGTGAGLPNSAVNIVIRGGEAYFQNTTGSVSIVNLNPLTNAGSSGGLTGTAVPTGLSIGERILHGAYARASGVPLAVWSLPSPAAAVVPAANALWSSQAVAPALMANPLSAGTGQALVPNPVGTNTSWLLTAPTSFATQSVGAPVAVGGPTATPVLQTTPVVGTGPRVYSVGFDGSLYVFDPAAYATGVGGATAWVASAPFGGALEVRGHPTLDCNRGPNGANRPGTLYVVGNVAGGNTGVLAASIVDSTKLDTFSPWPKWQRTAGNAGNPDFPLNSGCP